MKGLYPIIRRVRRPLLPPESLQTATDSRVVAPSVPQPADAGEEKGADVSNPQTAPEGVTAHAVQEQTTQEDY